LATTYELLAPALAETVVRESEEVLRIPAWAVPGAPVVFEVDVSEAGKVIPVTSVNAVDDAVSTKVNSNAGALAIVVSAGTLFTDAVIVYESVASKANPLTVIVPAVVESEADPVSDPVPFATVKVSWLPAVPENAACEGAELSKPIPNAATATSAMRLKFVFVDMCFLSIVVTRTFLVAASR